MFLVFLPARILIGSKYLNDPSNHRFNILENQQDPWYLSKALRKHFSWPIKKICSQMHKQSSYTAACRMLWVACGWTLQDTIENLGHICCLREAAVLTVREPLCKTITYQYAKHHHHPCTCVNHSASKSVTQLNLNDS